STRSAAVLFATRKALRSAPRRARSRSCARCPPRESSVPHATLRLDAILADLARPAVLKVGTRPSHSHSIVPGGLLVTSYTTRLMPRTSLTRRVETFARKECSNG